MRLTLAVAVVLLAAAASSCAPKAAPEMPVATRSGVRFSLLQADAQTVALAGSFNGWSTTSHAMSRQSSGLWTITVALPPGDHLFMYVVNGTQWIGPPAADDYADDGFGTRNGIVAVRPNE